MPPCTINQRLLGASFLLDPLVKSTLWCHSLMTRKTQQDSCSSPHTQPVLHKDLHPFLLISEIVIYIFYNMTYREDIWVCPWFRRLSASSHLLAFSSKMMVYGHSRDLLCIKVAHIGAHLYAEIILVVTA